MKKSIIPPGSFDGMNCSENLAVAFVHAGSLTKDPAKEVDRMTEDPATTEDLDFGVQLHTYSMQRRTHIFS